VNLLPLYIIKTDAGVKCESSASPLSPAWNWRCTVLSADAGLLAIAY